MEALEPGRAEIMIGRRCRTIFVHVVIGPLARLLAPFFLIALGAPIVVLVLRWRSTALIAVHLLETKFLYVPPPLRALATGSCLIAGGQNRKNDDQLYYSLLRY